MVKVEKEGGSKSLLIHEERHSRALKYLISSQGFVGFEAFSSLSFDSLLQSCKVGINVIPILQMRKLRLRKIRPLIQDHRASAWGSLWTPGIVLFSLHLRAN